MRKQININELEISFNYILKEIRGCFCDYTPKARRLKKLLTSFVSDIDFIKDLSYSFKNDLSQLKKEYPIPEHLEYDLNILVYDLERRLVGLSKFGNKFETLYHWFEKFAEMKNFIVLNSTNTYSIHTSTKINQPIEEHNEEDMTHKIIKFNHLL